MLRLFGFLSSPYFIDDAPIAGAIISLARELRRYQHGLGLGVETGKLLDVQLTVAITVELLQQHDDLGHDQRSLEVTGGY